MGMCRRVLVCGIKLIFMVLCRKSECHEGTDALVEFTDMDADKPQEGAACPLSHDHDCLRVHFFQI